MNSEEPGYLHEPGRNFAGMVPPQVQAVTTLPLIVGVNVNVLVSMFVSPKPCAVTVITPASLVSTLATYFEGDEADSQPHSLAAGIEPGAVWTTSVIAVRQVDAARISSETLAFFV